MINFEVRQSNIPSAGRGLFVLVDIPAETVILQYEGNIVDLPDPTDGTYSYYTNSGKVILGTSTARHINDNVDFRKFTFAETGRFFHNKLLPRVPSEHNVIFVERPHNCVDIVTTKVILAGAELLIDYGFAYWAPRVLRAGLTDHTYPIDRIRL